MALPAANASSSARTTQKMPRLVLIQSRPKRSSRIWWIVSPYRPSCTPNATMRRPGRVTSLPAPHSSGWRRARPRPSVPIHSAPPGSAWSARTRSLGRPSAVVTAVSRPSANRTSPPPFVPIQMAPSRVWVNARTGVTLLFCVAGGVSAATPPGARYVQRPPAR